MRVERVARHEKADQFLLARQLLRLRPFRHLGEGRRRAPIRPARVAVQIIAEQADLAQLALSLLKLRLTQRRLQALGQCGAAAEPVEGAGADQGFDHPFVVES